MANTFRSYCKLYHHRYGYRVRISGYHVPPVPPRTLGLLLFAPRGGAIVLRVPDKDYRVPGYPEHPQIPGTGTGTCTWYRVRISRRKLGTWYRYRVLGMGTGTAGSSNLFFVAGDASPNYPVAGRLSSNPLPANLRSSFLLLAFLLLLWSSDFHASGTAAAFR